MSSPIPTPSPVPIYRSSAMHSSSGYLELIIGPMYSGKSSRLVEIFKKCQFCNIPVVVINHDIDNRYDDELMSTHDKVMVPCMKTTQLRKVWPLALGCEVILINEGQFFDDLYEVVKEMVQMGKQVYVCGLDGDFERKRFGQILDLIPLCDTVTKLTSICSLCRDGTKAIFSMRLTSEKEQTVVGSDNYKPVCRSCYEAHYIR
jgi:thymidine kinase